MWPLLAFYAFAVGAIIGSFLNVVVHRYPREESIVFPASRCPSCSTPIKPYDNIPIVNFLWLRGRCRACREPISIRYPLVELANALFYLAIFLHTGVSWSFLPLAAIVSMTIVLIYIDADIQILPDVIDIPGIAIGIGMAAMSVGMLNPRLVLATSLVDSLLGAAIGGGVLLAIGLLYKLVRKVEGMGLGDVKMLAMIGAIVGCEPLIAVLLIASVTGAIVGVFVAMRSEEGFRVALPFGVFLGFALLVVLFFGQTLGDWWLAMLPAV
jgi:leader peptidase (prepilin peptidase)/N-methyltransferase